MICLSEYQKCKPDAQLREREKDLPGSLLKNGKKCTDLG